jgi:hypothetical protein
MWDATQNGGRWTVLCHHNRSHATLLVDDLGQRVDGSAVFIRHGLTGAERFGILDLGPVYAGQLVTARRGVLLTPDGGVVVRDEFSAPAGRRVRSGFPTRAKPVAISPGLLRLEQDGAAVHLRIDAPAGASWTVGDLRPERPAENQNEVVSLCAVTVVTDGGDQVLQVSLHRAAPGPVRDLPLDRW